MNLKWDRPSIYSQIGISIESLIEYIELVFRIGPLSIRGFHMVSGIVLFSILLYHLMVYYNCKTEKINPVNKVYAWNLMTSNRIKMSDFEL
jgi:hypothetical protein